MCEKEGAGDEAEIRELTIDSEAVRMRQRASKCVSCPLVSLPQRSGGDEAPTPFVR